MGRTRGALVLGAMTAVLLTQLGDSKAQDGLAGACAKVEAGKLPVCVELHASGTALRLPEDHGAVDRDTRFVTPSGRRYEISQALRDQIWPGYATTIYKATISGDTLTGLEPALRVRTDAIMRRLFAKRLLVGKITPRDSARRTRDPEFRGSASLPVVVSVGTDAGGRGLRGTILNSHRAVKVGRTCARALSAHPRNPLVDDYTRRVEVVRHPSMHVPFGDEQVFSWGRTSGMGSEFFPSLATLFGRDPMGRTWEITHHGVPWGGPGLTLRFAPATARARSC